MPSHSLTLLAIAAGTVSTLAAEDGPTIPELLRRIDELDQRVRILDRKAEIAGEEATGKARKATVASAGEDGFAIASADNLYKLRFNALVQIDGRWWLGDHDAANQRSGFLVRRVQPTLDAQLGKYLRGFVQTNFTGSYANTTTGAQTASLLEAWGEFKPSPVLGLRAGRGKVLGTEYLHSTGGLTFPERGLTTNLVPQYDTGVQLGGAAGRTLAWTLGIYNGAPDGLVRDSEVNDAKDGLARIIYSPFKGDDGSALKGLAITLAGTWGSELGSRAAASPTSGLGTIRSPGQVAVFQYAAGTYADGQRYRLAPSLEFYQGPLGVLLEYTRSSQEVRKATFEDTLANVAWQAVFGWVLTGEAKSSGGVVPRHAFDPDTGGWGAWEVAARIGQLSVDKDSFGGASAYVSRATNVSKESSAGLGINWWLTRNLKWQLSGDLTRFRDGGGGTANNGIDRDLERVLVTRFQVSY